MATKVLVFESDAAFAVELRNEFGKLGCSTTVVEDGNAGLQQAAAEKPDLILLSIELPRMNGFSVCNKLKKDPNLKDVPLIIMSSESSDETFEQHKKLRTRAEDYVHKPIAFGELLLHVQGFVPLAGGPGSEPDGAIVIDDEIEIGNSDYVAEDADAEISGEIPMPAATARQVEGVDADVDAFAESAFGRITGPDAAAAEAHAQQNGAPSVRPPPPTSTGVDRAEYERVCDELAAVKARFDDVDREFDEARNELTRVRAEAAEAARRAREVDELKAKLAAAGGGGGKGAGVSSREFLDLRETLNKKDKEILALKEASSKRDKQIVEAQDRALAAERAHSDLDDRLLQLEREISDTKEKNESLVADRDLAKKASEDFRARLEKARADGEARDRQLSDARERHAQELMDAEESFAALRAEVDQTLANERAEHARALDQAETRRKNELDRLRRDQEAQLAAVGEEHQEDLENVKAEAARSEQAALDAVRAELQSKAARELGQEKDRSAELERELAGSHTHAEALEARTGELESKSAALETRVTSLDSELGAARQEVTETRQRLMGETSRADKSHAKWQADRQSLERAKDALAVALAQIEEAEERIP
jgi:CheY-like chemotaxis protein